MYKHLMGMMLTYFFFFLSFYFGGGGYLAFAILISMNHSQTNTATCLRETAGVPFKNDYEFMMFFMIRKDI